MTWNNTLSILYNQLPESQIFYIMDWRLKESKNVPAWLAKQIIEHHILLKKIIDDNKLKFSDDDKTIIKILTWVINNIKYVKDIIQYKTNEYWATCNETLESKKGDCEDGAALIYCLAVVAGISEEKIFFVAGDVKGGGHSWIRYKSEKYPSVVFMIDWCYWANVKEINYREAFIEKAGKIIKPMQSKYYKYWFICNHKKGFRWI